MRRARNLKGALLLVLLVLLINLPILNSRYLDWRVEHSGEDVLATVRDSRVISPQDNPEFFLEFEFPRDVDPDQESWNVQVDEASYEAAVAAGELEVRVVADRPAVHQVEGQVRGRFGLIGTILADVVLVVLGLLLVRFRGRLRPQLHVAAAEDVAPCAPRSLLERRDDGIYVVCGEVSQIEADEIVLDLGDRSVRVLLGDHHNPVGHQQPARVVGRMIG